MESLIFLLLVVVILILLGIRSNLNRKFEEVQTRLDSVVARVNSLQKVDTPSKAEKVAATPSPASTPAPTPQPQTTRPEPVKEKEPVPNKSQVITPVSPSGEEPIPVFTSKHGPQKEVTPPRPGFFERNPDLEKFIGENLANKIGIGILVLGIGFFVKYAIDKEWINVYGRVLIGILCGGVLIGIAHRLRNSFAAFSSVLVGGGIAVLYLTITIAFHEYKIISQPWAFGIMVLITAFTVLLSVTYNRMELAVLAILGGFGAPFMVSTGEGNYVVLFTYILILDIGMLILAYFKKWNTVNVVSYVFTVFLFGSWITVQYDPLTHSMAMVLVFATVFYIVFFGMNIINNLKEKSTFGPLDFSMLLSNTFLYYAGGMYILNNETGEDLKGLFTAMIGVFNFVFAYTLLRSGRVDRNLVFLLIGLVLTFISLAAPIQLKGNYITLFWAAETVLLLWLSQQSGIRLMKIASAVVMMLTWISLAMDWKNIYGDLTIHLPVILNKGYITSFVSLVSVAGVYYFLRFEKRNEIPVVALRQVLILVGATIFYFWNYLELNHQLSFYAEPSAIPVIIGCYNILFLLALVLAERRFPLHGIAHQWFAAAGVLGAIAYLVNYHGIIVSARDAYLEGTSSFLGFGFHYLLITLLVTLVALSIQRFRTLHDFNASTSNVYSWFFVFFLLFLASAELDHTVLLTLSNGSADRYHVITQNHKIGYPILWGLSSFVLIAVGLRKKRRHLRIISLCLFLVTLLKLFIVDIRGISEGGKIAAFISLGVLLLIVSFMYQRLKKFLLSDEQSSDGSTDKML